MKITSLAKNLNASVRLSNALGCPEGYVYQNINDYVGIWNVVQTQIMAGSMKDTPDELDIYYNDARVVCDTRYIEDCPYIIKVALPYPVQGLEMHRICIGYKTVRNTSIPYIKSFRKYKSEIIGYNLAVNYAKFISLRGSELDSGIELIKCLKDRLFLESKIDERFLKFAYFILSSAYCILEESHASSLRKIGVDSLHSFLDVLERSINHSDNPPKLLREVVCCVSIYLDTIDNPLSREAVSIYLDTRGNPLNNDDTLEPLSFNQISSFVKHYDSIKYLRNYRCTLSRLLRLVCKDIINFKDL